MFLELFSQIPLPIWTALLGCFATITGVYISNRNSMRIKELDYKYQNNQREIERKLKLKESVFLSAAEVISRAHDSLPGLANLDVPPMDVGKAFEAASSSTAKIYTIAGQETINAVAEFRNATQDGFLELLLDRFQLDQRKFQIEMHQRFQGEALKEQENSIALMKEYNLHGEANPQKWDVIQNNFEFEKKKHVENSKRIDDLNEIKLQEHFKFIEKTMLYYQSTGLCLPKIVIAFRKELGLEIDEKNLIEGIRKELETGKARFTSWIQKLKKELV